jgi:hypothetical protein
VKLSAATTAATPNPTFRQPVFAAPKHCVEHICCCVVEGYEGHSEAQGNQIEETSANGACVGAERTRPPQDEEEERRLTWKESCKRCCPVHGPAAIATYLGGAAALIHAAGRSQLARQIN